MKLIIAILLICSTTLYAAPPFTLEHTIPVQYRLRSGTSTAMITVPVVSYLQLQRNLDLIERKIRENDNRVDSNFVQRGIDTTGATGTKTIYLPHKYASEMEYSVFTSGSVFAVVSVYRLSDSSFSITSLDPTGASDTWQQEPYVVLDWAAIGIRKK